MRGDGVTYRLGTTGERDVLSTLARIAEGGEAGAKRAAESWQQADRVAEAAIARRERAVERLKSLGGSSAQQSIAASTGLGSEVNYKDAEASMRVFIQRQDELASSRARLLAQFDPLFAAQQRYNATMSEAMSLDRQGALAAGELTTIQTRARSQLDALGVAHDRANKASASFNYGIQNIGFQLSDFAVQVGGGTSAIRAFAQQAPQTVQALAMMGAGAGNTTGKFAAFTRFLGGPWGAAATVAISVAGALASKIFDTGKAAEDAGAKTYDFSKHLNTLELDAKSAAEAMKQLADETRGAILWQGNFDRQRKDNADRAVTDQQGKLDQLTRDLAEAKRKAGATPTAFNIGEVLWWGQQVKDLQGEIAKTREALESAKAAASNAAIGDAQSRIAESLDQRTKIEADFNRAIGALNTKRDASKKLELSDDPLAIATYEGVYVSQKEYEAEAKRLAALKQQRLDAVKTEEEARQRLERAANKDLTAFGAPVSGGRISGRYGESRPGHMHSGTDYAVPVGTPVVAVADGVVSRAGQRGNYGNTIEIKIDDRTGTLDAHLTRFAVAVGDIVKKGDIIGYSGGARGAPGAGNSEGPHVHHEVRRDGRPVDPSGKYAIDEQAADTAAKIAEAEKALAEERERNEKSVRALLEAGDPALAIANKLKDDLAEIDRLAKIGPAGGGMGSEEADIARAQARQRAFNADFDLAMEPNAENREEWERADKAKREFISSTLADQGQQNRLLDVELGTVRASTFERDRQRSQLELIERLKERGIDLSSEEAQAIIRGNDALIDKGEELAKANALWEEQRRTGEAIIDTLFDPDNWNDWGELGKTIIRDLIKEMLVLAAINPLKNALFGSGLPTLGGGGIGGFLAGVIGAAAGGGRAIGTEYDEGGWHEVGEFGKELVRLPRGSQVVNTGRTRQMDRAQGRPAPAVFNINAPGADAAALRRVEDALQQLNATLENRAVSAVVDFNQRTFGAAFAV